MEVAGPALIFMGGSVIVYWFLILLIERGFCSCKRSPSSREDLVEAHMDAE